jgi:hypothetical protein
MSLEEKRKQILQLFDEKICKHIIGDLNILDGIQPETHANGCTIPTAMLILTSLDFIGYLLRRSGKLDETEVNLACAFKYNGLFPSTYSDDVIQKISHFYRHGMMHSFYPRQTSGQIYAIHKSNGSLLFEQANSNGVPVTSLNVNVLSSDFKNFINQLYDEIKITQDEALLDQMLKTFKNIRPDSISTSSLTTSTTTTTGATSSFGVVANK